MSPQHDAGRSGAKRTAKNRPEVMRVGDGVEHDEKRCPTTDALTKRLESTGTRGSAWAMTPWGTSVRDRARSASAPITCAGTPRSRRVRRSRRGWARRAHGQGRLHGPNAVRSEQFSHRLASFDLGSAKLRFALAVFGAPPPRGSSIQRPIRTTARHASPSTRPRLPSRSGRVALTWTGPLPRC